MNIERGKRGINADEDARQLYLESAIQLGSLNTVAPLI